MEMLSAGHATRGKSRTHDLPRRQPDPGSRASLSLSPVHLPTRELLFKYKGAPAYLGNRLRLTSNREEDGQLL